MTRIRRTATVLVASTALLLAGGAAHAAQKSATDETGDAGAVVDITRVIVKNSEETLSIKVKLAKARAGRSHVVATLVPAAEGAPTFTARTTEAGPGKKVGATLESMAPDATEPTPVECDGLKASVSSGRRGQVSVRIPQSCLGDYAGTMVVDVTTVNGEGDTADELPTSLRVKKG